MPIFITPEQEARSEIDRLLIAAGWAVQPRDEANVAAALGVAICEYPLKKGFADYLLYVDGAAVGVIEAKKTGMPLTAVEIHFCPDRRLCRNGGHLLFL